MSHILVVDDDARMRMMLRRGLEFEGHLVLEAETGSEALNLLRTRNILLVILDITMPDLSGLEVLKKVRSSSEHIPVILLTAKDHPDDHVYGLESGADDYITKPFYFDVLLARVRLILKRFQPDTKQELRHADLHLDLQRHQVTRSGRILGLSPLEFRLLQCFMENPERVFTKPMLLDRVWGMDYFGDVNVVEVAISALRQKLEEGGASRLIHTIRGAGYILRED
ncbi:response regulator transcription factor [Deinococcus cellulosilyticus]|uniref:DNA-binding response regulator n=1 Tax=Deinococcus cellulosilyticus (strain DSM 18568 / NBRC 106333 / KACC 11606 / 5516J-15) TaxID=1223518 RepID=A0A511MYF7_DEIC1|nr:response regulator transcription factor [Deinococcus cellulosilyticus]GEM45603.1 DNA-binding response regulator [Deinococcus cellulosilyticus NBRC 106333 = KACC 11606]